MKPAYVSFSERTFTGAHMQTYCMCQQRLRESCTGEKKRKYDGGGEGGNLENRFMKWSFPNSTICLLWGTPFINHHIVAENRAFGGVLDYVCSCLCICKSEKEKNQCSISFIFLFSVTHFRVKVLRNFTLQVSRLYRGTGVCMRAHMHVADSVSINCILSVRVGVGFTCCPPTGYFLLRVRYKKRQIGLKNQKPKRKGEGEGELCIVAPGDLCLGQRQRSQSKKEGRRRKETVEGEKATRWEESFSSGELFCKWALICPDPVTEKNARSTALRIQTAPYWTCTLTRVRAHKHTFLSAHSLQHLSQLFRCNSGASELFT